MKGQCGVFGLGILYVPSAWPCQGLGGRLQRLRAKRKDQMRQHSYSKDTGLTMRMGLTIVLLALVWVSFMERPRRFEGR